MEQTIGLSQMISIHAPHAGSDVLGSVVAGIPMISIHAPHAGSDQPGWNFTADTANFNPRSPCGERQFGLFGHFGPVLYFNPRSPCGERQAEVIMKLNELIFQSTLPMRGATTVFDNNVIANDFNPRSPCGERLTAYWTTSTTT